MAAGVMLFLSFEDILKESITHFAGEPKYANYSTKYALYIFYIIIYLYSISFFMGCFLAYFLSYISTLISKSQRYINTKKCDRKKFNSLSSSYDKDEGQSLLNSMEEGKSSGTNSLYESETDLTLSNIERKIESTADEEIPEEDRRKLILMSIITTIALSVHNFPEGIALYTATIDDMKLGLTLGIAMIIHNCPEGIAVAIPTYFATKSKKRAIIITAISGIANPLGAFATMCFFKHGVSDFTFGVMFGLVAGIMTFITLQELLPNAYKYDKEDKVASRFVLLGMMLVGVIIMFL